MNYKLEHLSKFCCRPSNELEFEAVKMAAKLGEINGIYHKHLTGFYYFYDPCYDEIDYGVADAFYVAKLTKIPVLDFCKKLRMTEEEAEKLEDDRVEFDLCKNWIYGAKNLKALNGHYFKTNADGTEVTLHKK